MIAIYLRAGSDLTEKWFGKTNTTFLKKYIAHSDFIGDLINSNDIRSLNSNSYRKLIHSFWIEVNTDSAKISFDELRKQTQKEKFEISPTRTKQQYFNTSAAFQGHTNIC